VVLNRTYTLSPTSCLFHADAREALRILPDNSIDAVPCDPPYALVSIVKRFGSPNAAPAKGNDAYMRASAGFMGKSWDTGECAMDPAFWAEVLRVLKPGGHLVAFGASRGYHRMACAIEDAGFEIRDSFLDLINPADPFWQFFDSLNDVQRDALMRCIDHARPGGTLAWLYGTGFPKSHNMDGEWQGFGTALKPAFEPIVLARKPLSEGTIAANVLRWGTGALNIDGCRIEAMDKTPAPVGQYGGSTIGPNGHSGIRDGSADSLGRWPANVIHDGSDEVVTAFPSAGGQQGRAKNGGAKSGAIYGKFAENVTANPEPRGDSGSAARFFYSAKASKADRAGSKHPTVKPVALMQWLCRLITPPGGTVLDPFAGSGTTGAAAALEGFNSILIEREAEYVQDILARFAVGKAA
jgi:site-specific DNA-methyltransferase (adenine-specific)